MLTNLLPLIICFPLPLYYRLNANYSTWLNHESQLIDTRVEVVNRRRIVPNQPITYYIDPTVPERWRMAFKKGVEAWKPAFEAAGLGPNAIRGVLPNESAFPSDYRAGDMRYSTISWSVDVDSTFALGPAVVDPRSGEILKSDIIFTHGWLKSWVSNLEANSKGDVQAKGRKLQAEDNWWEGDNFKVEEHNHDHDEEHSHDHGKTKKSKRPWGSRKSLRYHDKGKCQAHRGSLDLSPRLLQLAMEARVAAVSLHQSGFFAFT